MLRSPLTLTMFINACLLTSLLAKPSELLAQVEAGPQDSAAASDAPSLADVMKMLQAQQVQLDEQKKLISDLQAKYQSEKNKYDEEIANQQNTIDEQRNTLRTMQAKIDELSNFDPTQLTKEDKEFRSRLESLEDSINESQNASSTSFDTKSFPGSFPVPGTTAALKIGGFVKANYIQNFDTIGSQDRFVVGTIPTTPGPNDPNAEMTVEQSRLNFDLRDNTVYGPMRAFIEGDFAGGSAGEDLFRLRHAFGQFHDFLAGKTWSVMVDTEADPEDIDFEGISARINVRQAQFRWFPKIGKQSNLIMSLEDPTVYINNGTGTSLFPDFIVSVRHQWLERFHVKSALILRQLEGTWDANPSVTGSAGGWGLTISGKTAVTRWDPRDNLMFQLNYGKGYGRYVNDLGTLEQGDAVFDDSGQLFALPVVAGYIALQKWWNDTMRSNFVASYVNVNTYDFQPGDAYHFTDRVSGNLIWSPVARVDIGGELIWGKRQNKDKAKGTATQLQLSTKYRF